jgi:hypothetical protein
VARTADRLIAEVGTNVNPVIVRSGRMGDAIPIDVNTEIGESHRRVRTRF